MQNQETNNKETRELKFNNFFNSLKIEIDIDFNYFLKYGEQTTFEEVTEALENNDALTCEIIYYSNAINYLKENDPSLTESLALANEYGQTLENLNSETLASLLATENLRNQFFELEAEISEFLEELQELEDQEEEIQELKEEFLNMDKMPMYEIEVFNIATNEQENILFDVEIVGDNLNAYRVALTTEEEKSDCNNFESVKLDTVFSLDEHIQELYTLSTEAILKGDLYELAE